MNGFAELELKLDHAYSVEENSVISGVLQVPTGSWQVSLSGKFDADLESYVPPAVSMSSSEPMVLSSSQLDLGLGGWLVLAVLGGLI